MLTNVIKKSYPRMGLSTGLISAGLLQPCVYLRDIPGTNHVADPWPNLNERLIQSAQGSQIDRPGDDWHY